MMNQVEAVHEGPKAQPGPGSVYEQVERYDTIATDRCERLGKAISVLKERLRSVTDSRERPATVELRAAGDPAGMTVAPLAIRLERISDRLDDALSVAIAELDDLIERLVIE